MLTIDINMKPCLSSTKYQQNPSEDKLLRDLSEDQNKKTSKNKGFYLEVIDNGPGINPKQLMECLTSFGGSNLSTFKSDYNLSEHGIGLKLDGFRLGSTVLIITKTKPVVEFGSH